MAVLPLFWKTMGALASCENALQLFLVSVMENLEIQTFTCTTYFSNTQSAATNFEIVSKHCWMRNRDFIGLEYLRLAQKISRHVISQW